MPARLLDLRAFPFELLLIDHLLLRPGLLQFLQPSLAAFQKPNGMAVPLFELLHGRQAVQAVRSAGSERTEFTPPSEDGFLPPRDYSRNACSPS